MATSTSLDSWTLQIVGGNANISYNGGHVEHYETNPVGDMCGYVTGLYSDCKTHAIVVYKGAEVDCSKYDLSGFSLFTGAKITFVFLNQKSNCEVPIESDVVVPAICVNEYSITSCSRVVEDHVHPTHTHHKHSHKGKSCRPGKCGNKGKKCANGFSHCDFVDDLYSNILKVIINPYPSLNCAKF